MEFEEIACEHNPKCAEAMTAADFIAEVQEKYPAAWAAAVARAGEEVEIMVVGNDD